MDQKNQPVFKGMQRHRHADFSEELRDASRSPYRWWWSYLQLSKDYWWVCQQNGDTLDSELKKMWEDFGDVSHVSFAAWWQKNGRRLFAEQVRLPHVRQIDEQLTNLSPNIDGHVLVEIPLNMTERTISRQVLAIVRQHPNRLIKPVSKAKRPLCKLRGIRMSVLSVAHDVWCLNELVERAKLPNSTIGKPFDKMHSYQIGHALRLVRNCMPHPTDGEDRERQKRNGMKVAVSRMLTRANALIANAEIGLFPSFDPVEPRQRWTAKQQAELDAAIAAGKWNPPAVNEGTFRQQFDRPKLPK